MANLDAFLRTNPRVLQAGPGPILTDGECVLHWMQRAQRGTANAALNLAVHLGDTLGRPVLSVFGLTAHYPSAQRRQYRFLVDGLPETATHLAKRGVPFLVRLGPPDEVVLQLAAEVRPAVVVTDENPLKIGRQWSRLVADGLRCALVVVDADVVVPSSYFPREEYAARTLRPKVHRLWDEYLQPIPDPKAAVPYPSGRLPIGEPIDADALLEKLGVEGIGEAPDYLGGTAEAMRRLRRFLSERLEGYAAERNEPTPYHTTELSAHLHFGHINPLTIALAVRESGAPQADIDSLLEELIVRRELAINFVARNPNYDTLSGCPSWALQTLEKHRADPRPHLYTLDQLESAETHDPLWNAAQREMVRTGRMHNYLRMYWAKKVLEWSPDAETAFHLALDLNDRYEMDGRDPNGYAGIAWAIGGKHDRPWPERPIFGTVRFMSYESTRKKFDSASYIRANARV